MKIHTENGNYSAVTLEVSLLTSNLNFLHALCDKVCIDP